MIELRPFAKDDIPLLIRWIDSPELLRQWGGTGFTYPLNESQMEERWREAAGEEPRLLPFKVVETDGEVDIGYIELAGIDRRSRSAYIALALVGPEHLRGQGIGTQMIRAILRLGFEQLGLHRIGLAVFTFNRSAIACYEKAGFRKEGVIRESVKVGDEYWSSAIMSILEDEWRATI